MRSLWARVRYFVRSAWIGLRASPVTSAVAVATIGVTLLLVGAFSLLVSNMQALVDRVGEDLVLSAWLDEDPGEGAHQALRERVAALEGVTEVTLVTKQEALERFRSGVGGRSELLEGLEENPLPASLEIRLDPAFRSGDRVGEVTRRLEGLPGIEELGFGQEWVASYARAVALVRVIGIVIGGVLSMAALMIVANTIRLAVYARRDEIEILLLVGAGRSFVAVPFLLEGLVQGALGGVLALGLLAALFQLLVPAAGEGVTFLFGYGAPAFLGPSGMLGLVAGGAALGVLGSAVAVVQGWRS